MPVITVTDRKIRARTAACVTMNIHEASAFVNTTHSTRISRTPWMIRAMRCLRGSGGAAPSVRGGGSTPASGSPAS